MHIAIRAYGNERHASPHSLPGEALTFVRKADSKPLPSVLASVVISVTVEPIVAEHFNG